MEKCLYSTDIVCSGRPPAHSIIPCLSIVIGRCFSTTDSLSTKRYETISLVGQSTVANWASIAVVNSLLARLKKTTDFLQKVHAPQ
jgi:hypothetical protein